MGFHMSIWGGLALCLGGLSPPKPPPRGDGTATGVPRNFYSLENCATFKKVWEPLDLRLRIVAAFALFRTLTAPFFRPLAYRNRPQRTDFAHVEKHWCRTTLSIIGFSGNILAKHILHFKSF